MSDSSCEKKKAVRLVSQHATGVFCPLCSGHSVFNLKPNISQATWRIIGAKPSKEKEDYDSYYKGWNLWQRMVLLRL